MLASVVLVSSWSSGRGEANWSLSRFDVFEMVEDGTAVVLVLLLLVVVVVVVEAVRNDG